MTACSHGEALVEPHLHPLLSRVTIEGPHWMWQGRINRKGYGRVGVGGRQGRDWLAHRWSWTLTWGQIPAGLCVLHKCDIPACINPYDCLFLGTIADNNADMKQKDRERKATGEAHPWVKLSSAEVALIRQRRDQGELLKSLASEFGVHAAHLSRITRGLGRVHDGM